MDRDLRGRQSKDQPAPAGVNRLKSEQVGQERPISVSILAEEYEMGSEYHRHILSDPRSGYARAQFEKPPRNGYGRWRRVSLRHVCDKTAAHRWAPGFTGWPGAAPDGQAWPDDLSPAGVGPPRPAVGGRPGACRGQPATRPAGAPAPRAACGGQPATRPGAVPASTGGVDDGPAARPSGQSSCPEPMRTAARTLLRATAGGRAFEARSPCPLPTHLPGACRPRRSAQASWPG